MLLSKPIALQLRTLGIGILLFSFGSVLNAQESGPNLSGVWQLNVAKSKVAKNSNKHLPLKPATLRITCKTNTVQMIYTSGSIVTTRTYTTDGKEQDISQGTGSRTVSKAHWKKGVLVIETSGQMGTPGGVIPFGTELIHDTERWSLSPDGNTLTHEEDNPRLVYIFDRVNAEAASPNAN
jgi:hypothetical protein